MRVPHLPSSHFDHGKPSEGSAWNKTNDGSLWATTLPWSFCGRGQFPTDSLWVRSKVFTALHWQNWRCSKFGCYDKRPHNPWSIRRVSWRIQDWYNPCRASSFETRFQGRRSQTALYVAKIQIWTTGHHSFSMDYGVLRFKQDHFRTWRLRNLFFEGS